MKTETPKITLPDCLKLETLAKWIEGDQHKLKLRLSNTANGKSMDFDYSGGCLAFMPEKLKCPIWNATLAEVRAALSKQRGVAYRHINAIDAMQWANDNAVIDPCGVVYALLSDSRAGMETFDAFCAEYGYDEYSPKAESTWNACRANGEKFHRVVGGLCPELDELLADY